MKLSFWIQFAIQEALSVLAAYLQTTAGLTDQQKADGEAFIAAGQKFLGDF